MKERDALPHERGIAIKPIGHLAPGDEGVGHRQALGLHRAAPIPYCSEMFRRKVFAKDAMLACSRASISIAPPSSQRTG